MLENIRVTRWDGTALPTETDLLDRFAAEDLPSYRWMNEPGDVYAAHSHSYHKVIYVVRGSITFGLPEHGERITLNAGDRLDLPAGVVHNAVVGAQGVVCLEAQR